MEIKYDEPIEVNKKQYDAVRAKFSGMIAYSKIGDKYFIKVWVMQFAPFIKIELEINADT
ncbi:hypothetical protein [Flavobacterium sp.]|uniref:hypothetical protein n=1 Tax=Flavobacterium sp. TaxID=239 RepID=UPI0026345F94|nr:hypothetical protein [Flavobacterium sp.]